MVRALCPQYVGCEKTRGDDFKKAFPKAAVKDCADRGEPKRKRNRRMTPAQLISILTRSSALLVQLDPYTMLEVEQGSGLTFKNLKDEQDNMYRRT